MKFFSVRHKILFMILIPFILIVVLTDVFLYLDRSKMLFKNYKILQMQTESNIVDSIKIVDKSYEMLENFMKEPLAQAAGTFLAEYEKSGHDISKMDLESIKKKLNNDVDLYIIDDGVITRATYARVIGIDFRKYPDFFQKLQNILANDTIVYDRLSIELTTGKLRLWAYIPSPDKKYIFELGLSSAKVMNAIGNIDIIRIAGKLKDYNRMLINVRIYDRLGCTINSDEYGRANIESLVDLIKKKKTYEISENSGSRIKRYIYVNLLDDKIKPSDPSKIVELTYDITPIKKQLDDFILGMIIFTIIIIVVVFIASAVLSGMITAPVIDLYNAVKKFSE